jgi:predicted PurR-regulated permease PerM
MPMHMKSNPRSANSPEAGDRQPSAINLLDPLREPVGIHSLALTGLFILAVFYTLYIARAFFIPVILAVLLNFLLWPLVRGLKRLHVPEVLGSALVLLGLLLAVGYGVYLLSEPAMTWMEKAPQSLQQLERKLRTLRKPVDQVSKAAERVEQIARAKNDKKVPQVELKRPGVAEVMLSGTQSFIAEVLVVCILLYFLLASGDLFLQKIVKVLPRLQDKKRAVEIIRETEEHVSTYLLTVTLVNAGLGVATGLAMYILGMPNPLLWGVMVGLLNFIPYLGATVNLIVLTLVAILTFSDLRRALLVPAVFFGLATLEGNFVTPMILGRRLALNPVVIFITLIFWGWMWGIAGALLAVPMLSTLKIICDRIEPLAPIGEFLGR